MEQLIRMTGELAMFLDKIVATKRKEVEALETAFRCRG